MVRFTLRDLQETVTGAGLASLLFIVLRSGSPLSFNITAGVVITLFIIWLSNPKPLARNLDVLAFDVIVAYATVATLNIIFELATLDMVTFGLMSGTFPNLAVFGSSVAVSFWIGLPVAVLYNKHNINNFLSRIFIHKR